MFLFQSFLYITTLSNTHSKKKWHFLLISKVYPFVWNIYIYIYISRSSFFFLYNITSQLIFEIFAKQQQNKNTKFGERVCSRSTHPLLVPSLQKFSSHPLYRQLASTHVCCACSEALLYIYIYIYFFFFFFFFFF